MRSCTLWWHPSKHLRSNLEDFQQSSERTKKKENWTNKTGTYVTTWHGTVWFQGFLAVSRETAISWYPTAVLILKHVLFNQVSEKCVWTRKTCAIRQLRLAPENKKHQKTRLRIAAIISSTNRKLNQREQESLYVAFQRHLKGVNYTPIKNNRMPPKKSGNMRAAASSIVFWGKKTKLWDFGGPSCLTNLYIRYYSSCSCCLCTWQKLQCQDLASPVVLRFLPVSFGPSQGIARIPPEP